MTELNGWRRTYSALVLDAHIHASPRIFIGSDRLPGFNDGIGDLYGCPDADPIAEDDARGASSSGLDSV